MEDLSPKNTNTSEIHWFWRLTTKWYFFPSLYLILAIILSMLAIILKSNVFESQLSEIKDFPNALSFMLIFLGSGLIFLILPSITSLLEVPRFMPDFFSWALVLISHIFIISSYFVIPYFWKKKKIILKKLIIVLLIFLLLNFSSCVFIISQ